MSSATPVAAGGPASPPYRAAQTRIINVALDLFAKHGVGGTSLQMIADALGVTKAAVYHQFKTKDEIVLAAAEAELARVETAIEAAGAEPDPARAREVLIARIVDLAVERRRMESTLLGDPVIIRFFAHHEPFRQVMDRLYRLLMGDNAGPDARVLRGDAHGRDRRRRHTPARRGPRRRDAPSPAPPPRPPVAGPP